MRTSSHFYCSLNQSNISLFLLLLYPTFLLTAHFVLISYSYCIQPFYLPLILYLFPTLTVPNLSTYRSFCTYFLLLLYPTFLLTAHFVLISYSYPNLSSSFPSFRPYLGLNFEFVSNSDIATAFVFVYFHTKKYFLLFLSCMVSI